MHNVIIIDDAVDIETQNKIEQSIFSPETQWTLGRTVFYHSHAEVNVEHKNKLMGITKSLFRYDDRYVDKDIDLYVSPLQNGALRANIPFRELHTARIQCHFPIINQSQYGIPHTDGQRNFPYMVGVYYINESDGGTVLFKQTIHNSTPDEVKDGKLEIDQVVPYKKGRLVLFSGDIYHSAGKPTSDLRCIINFNFS